MPTGKPNFNLNSYGIKYLSKEEVQEFLEKRQGESIRSQGETRTRPLGTSGKPMDSGSRQAGQHRGSTAGLKQGEFTPSLAGSKQIDTTINTPKPEAEKPATATSSTRSQFMSRETPSKLSHTERKLRQDMESSGTKVNPSGIVTQRQKPQPETKPNEGKAPNRPTEHIGSIVDGGKVLSLIHI